MYMVLVYLLLVICASEEIGWRLWFETFRIIGLELDHLYIPLTRLVVNALEMLSESERTIMKNGKPL